MSLLVGMLLKHVICKLFTIETELLRFTIPMNLLYLLLVAICFYLFKLIKTFATTIDWSIRLDWVGQFVIFVTFLHLISLGASSFIEEEQQIWYYVCISLFIILFVKELRLHLWIDGEFVLFKFPSDDTRTKKKAATEDERRISKSIEKCHHSIFSFLVLMLTHVVVRRLNQTGDKWSHLPDIGDFLAEKDNKAYLTILVIVAMILTCISLLRLGGLLTNVLTFTALLLILFYRASIGQVLVFNTVFSSPKWPVILFWLNVSEVVLIEFLPFVYRLAILRSVNSIELGRFMGSSVTVFSVVSILLHKPQNVILVPVCVLTCRWVKDKILAGWSGIAERTVMIIVTHLWIGKMFFFYQVSLCYLTFFVWLIVDTRNFFTGKFQ